MTERAGTDLAVVIEAAAQDLEDAIRQPTESGAEWAIEGRVFAAISGPTAEFRLDPAIARAALRTPDTAPSPRGPDWVAFRPSELNPHAIDRATAWLGSAWRRADGEG